MTDHYYTSETENVGQFRCENHLYPFQRYVCHGPARFF
mgnify:CR=1 FL=1